MAEQTPHLTAGQEYLVVALDHESFRVLNDNKEPILYPKEMFDIVDSDLPENWVWVRFADDEYYADPPELASPGFYEDWFDSASSAREIFENYLKKVPKAG